MKQITFSLFLSVGTCFAQTNEPVIYDIQTSECLAQYDATTSETSLIDFNSNDSCQVITFISTTNCGGIHSLKLDLTNDTIRVSWQEGGVGEVGVDSLWHTEKGLFPYSSIDTTVTEGELVLINYTEYVYLECDCCFEFRIQFGLLPPKTSYVVQIKEKYFQVETSKKKKKRVK